MTEQRVQNLVKKYFRNECTSEEKVVLARWIEESARDLALKKILEDTWKEYVTLERMPANKAENILSAIFNSTKESEPAVATVRYLWFRRAAIAAVITTIVATGGYYALFNHSTNEIAAVNKTLSSPRNDADPGGRKATLTLSDLSTIIVDTSAHGIITRQGNTQVIGNKGELVYNAATDHSITAMYNTLSTQRAELFPVTLSDGTKIWLNSASSLRFPVAFNGNERVVDITGEAYFEVAKNPAKPFKVRVNGMEIEVLGTHFNINGYANESIIKTTLLEGSLKVTKGSEGVLLTPGQEARLKSNGKIEVIKDANTEEAVSWKDGYLHFQEANLETVMRQLSRWYDVDIEYESKHEDQLFSGDIDKSLNLSGALKLMERSQVHCKIVGKKLVVLH